MLKVLIADDEEKVSELIQYLVPWDRLGMEIAAVVSNGFKAIQVLEREKIDILISDARMPGCDGIELIKWCHDNDLDMKFIIISGYRHFEYAHGALQYGVDYYLLKPIKQEELVVALTELSHSISEQNKKLEEEHQIQKLMYLNRDNLRRHFIHSYIFDGKKFLQKEIDSVTQINDQYQLNFQSGVYQAIFVKLDLTENRDMTIEKLLHKIKSIMEEDLKKDCNELVGTILHSGVIMLINYPMEQQHKILNQIKGFYKKIEQTIDIFENLRVIIGISKTQYDIKNINQCIVTAGDAIKYRIRNKDKDIIEYEKYAYDNINVKDILTPERCEIITSSVRSHNIVGIKKVIHSCKIDIKQHSNYNPVIVFDLVTELSYLISRTVDGLLEEEYSISKIYDDFNESIDAAVTEKQIWEIVDRFVERSTEYIYDQMTSVISRPIRRAKEYIDQHYNEPMTLETVANEIGLSPTYLSAVFRKETGVNFSEYLIAKRVEVGAELLRKTNKTIAEIAETVGYSDVKYFGKLCKKMLGLKPSEYRKLYL